LSKNCFQPTNQLDIPSETVIAAIIFITTALTAGLKIYQWCNLMQNWHQ